MGYAKERGKLEKLLINIAEITIYNEKNLAILNDCHDKFSHTIRILKNKAPDIFSDLYKVELQEVKESKKLVKEIVTDEIRQDNFITYKKSLINALEKTVKTTTEV